MRSPAKPFALLAAVSAATFAFAQWHPFSPSAPASSADGPSGDVDRGAAVFATTCASCHGAEGEGGVGPTLRGSGLSAAEVEAVVAEGRGTMPAALVTGQDAADVAAHVASIAK